MNELVKSMRATTMDSGLMDSGSGGELATGMLDQQFAGQLTGMRGGLSEAIARQLERQMGLAPGPIPATSGANAVPAPLGRPPGAPARIPERGAAGFVEQHTRAAQAAEAGQRHPGGLHGGAGGARVRLGPPRDPARRRLAFASTCSASRPAAAGPGRWPRSRRPSTSDGQARKVTAKFRAYGSYAESFADYAQLMKNSPRYQAVIQADTAREFAQGLQRAGYATDPAYADKLTRVINATLRLQRSQI